MAIITCNLGKWVSVHQGCFLGLMLTRLKCAELAVRLEDECNSEIFTIKNWIQCASLCKDSSLSKKDLQIMNETWHNTVTVTFQGAVIIRFSWSNPVQWTHHHEEMALKASQMVAWLVKNCS